MSTTIDFGGEWRIAYWYPSNEQMADDISEYVGRAHMDGQDIVFESQPNDEQSYILARLSIEDGIAIGSWHETTSPSGAFQGAVYSGSGQLIVDPETGNMEGKWAGAGYDHKLKAMRIYTGNWEITRISKAAA